MLLPPLCTQQGYVQLATDVGLKVFGGPKDISKDVSKTWSVELPFVQYVRLTLSGISRGHLCRIPLFGASRSARVGMALPFCSRSERCGEDMPTAASVMPSCRLPSSLELGLDGEFKQLFEFQSRRRLNLRHAAAVPITLHASGNHRPLFTSFTMSLAVWYPQFGPQRRDAPFIFADASLVF